MKKIHKCSENFLNKTTARAGNSKVSKKNKYTLVSSKLSISTKLQVAVQFIRVQVYTHK